MNPNLNLIENHNIYYQKITILTSTVRKCCDEYIIENEFEEIVKKNYDQNTSCVIKTNYENIFISEDLKQEKNMLFYDCDNISHTRRCWNPSNSKELKVSKDMPKLQKYVDNSRCRISKRVFGKKNEYLGD